MARQKKMKVKEIKSKMKVTEITGEGSELEQEIDDELDGPARRANFEFSGRGGAAPVLERMDIEQEQSEEPRARVERNAEQTTGVRYTPLMAGGYEAVRKNEGEARYDTGRESETVGATPTLIQEQRPEREGTPLFRRGLREGVKEEGEKYESNMGEQKGEKRAKRPWE